MKLLLGFSMLLLALATLVNGQQRVAPGVPPQRYEQGMQHGIPQMPSHPQMQQQQPPPQQVPQMQQQVQYQQSVQQQQQMQQQQIPQQQMPVQQVPVQQVPQHQIPAQGMHQPQQGNAHHGHQQMLNTANIMQEKQHIQEHMDIPLDTSKMTEQELQFHYFKMHDADRNDKLDGCELIKSLIHWHEQGHKDPNNPGANQAPQEKIFSDDELVALIDPIMKMDDSNNDGFIDYPEFVRAQNKAAAAGART